MASDAPLALTMLVRERVLLELARGGGAAGAAEVFRAKEPQLTRADVRLMLGEFPELLRGGEFEDFVAALSPSADDPALRCRCYRIKAWNHEVAGRPDAARIYWDSLATGSERPSW